LQPPYCYAVHYRDAFCSRKRAAGNVQAGEASHTKKKSTILMKDKYREILVKYLPEKAVDIALDFLLEKKVSLSFKLPRTSRYGDYRPPNKQKGRNYHRISLNNNLPPMHLLLVFLHEAAHLLTFEETKNLKEPHGNLWKYHYRVLILEHIKLGSIQGEILPYAIAFVNGKISHPKFKSCVEATFSNKSDTSVSIKNLALDSLFAYKNKVFKVGERRRTRYFAEETKSGRIYLFHPEALVEPVNQQEASLA